MMQVLEISEIINKIQNFEFFDAVAASGSFEITVESYQPVAGFAVHNGSDFPENLEKVCALSPLDRWREEDPCTGDFIDSLPIRVKALDSRYFYDLNRPPESCVYSGKAWGKMVWISEPAIDCKMEAVRRHSAFYRVANELVAALEKSSEGALSSISTHTMHAGQMRLIRNLCPFLISEQRRSKIEALNPSLKISLIISMISNWKESETA